ncbi:MAG: hypothetical protein COA62_09385 [Rhodobiaceae bacterium]|nr:MAG: hypothetical protein COA62_09385 [Rhodobiaceae bacterium]
MLNDPTLPGLTDATALDELQLLDTPTHLKSEELFNYWSTKLNGKTMPSRRDIDPIEIPTLLPDILLIDVDRTDKLRFKIRLAGTGVVHFIGKEPTGKYFEELSAILPEGVGATLFDRWTRICAHVCEHHKPTFVSIRHADPARNHHIAHAAALPLTNEGTDVDQIFAVITTELVDVT